VGNRRVSLTVSSHVGENQPADPELARLAAGGLILGASVVLPRLAMGLSPVRLAAVVPALAFASRFGAAA
jgi:hypothetical protein